MATKKESKADKSESVTYQQMLDEVETLVRDVASSELDLDAMVGKVERGYGLIKSMRERLDSTKLKIDQLRTEFEET